MVMTRPFSFAYFILQERLKGGAFGLAEDTLGGLLKTDIAQFLALELTKFNSRDNRATSRYLPWLYHPSTAIQQG